MGGYSVDTQQWILDNVPPGSIGITYKELHALAPFEHRTQLAPQLAALTRKGLTREAVGRPGPGQPIEHRVYKL